MKEYLPEFLRDKRRRLFCSFLAGMAACVIAAGAGRAQRPQGVLAWWGTLYPEFCFSKTEEPKDGDEEVQSERPGISFWLAKALNW